ncbi:MAG: 2-C-methyl-D-erythritol 4-phosphate cytidylyltransferase [Micromonosporaceae bacterium]|nr:2-C-methyl-D-erythritol 4-phosphate cytidylyltransferase [Micromonosporaceae bacterium]
MTAQQGMCGDVAVLVPAAGAGTRLGPGAPKALRLLCGETLLVHAVRRVVATFGVGCVVVSAPSTEVRAVDRLLEAVRASAPAVGISVVVGGTTRQASVAAALAAVPSRFPIVLVHDAARALAPPELIERVADAVRNGSPAVIPVLPVIDTITRVDDLGVAVGTVDRSSLRAVQTPQGFRREILVAAHEAAVDDHTDDAGLAEKIGVVVHTVPGDEVALKITRPLDLALAEMILARGVR